MHVRPGDLDDPGLQRLLAEHLAEMRRTTPPESTHALDLEGLRAPGVRIWVAVDGDDDGDDDAAGEVLGCAAFAPLGAGHLELKSMRTAAAHLRRGVARLLLRHLLDVARAEGSTRISLETGSQDYFAPARQLYARHGFVTCPPFGSYREDPNSTFMTLVLGDG